MIPCKPNRRAPRRFLGWLMAAAVVLSSTTAAAAVQPALPGSGAPHVLEGSRAVFWSQPPDVNGSKISSEIIEGLDLESEVASDFFSGTDTEITTITWWGGYYRLEQGGADITDFNIRFYNDSSCLPTSLVTEIFVSDPTITPIDDDPQGNPSFRYDALVRVPVQGGVTYWITIQADGHFLPGQWGRLEAGDVLGCQSVFRSDYFGYPDWVEAEQIVNEEWDASIELNDDPSPLEACCYPNGFCEYLLPDDCTEQGGTPLGPESDCSACIAEPSEACCLTTGDCIAVPAVQCLDFGGAPQGEGTDCEPNPCPAAEACCFEFSICQMMVPDSCAAYEGIPQGPGSVCDPNPCILPGQEACCVFGGTCLMLDPSECADFGGTAQGPGSICDPNPCLGDLVACCYDEGACSMLTEEQCTLSGGTSQGAESTCDPNPCPQPAQACCFDDGSCQELTEEDCLTAGGLTGGVGLSCDPNPCPIPTRTETKTWGGIKAGYR